MNKPLLGMLIGAALGVLDGLSAWASPEARSMMIAIVLGSTVKGLLTGAVMGWVAQRAHSLIVGVAGGLACGFVLSSLAAWTQPAHYWEIVLPGMLLGAIVGFVTQRYPRDLAVTTPSRNIVMVILATSLGAIGASDQLRFGSQADRNSPVPCRRLVNQYVLEDSQVQRLVFASESIENIPAGWRARETYILAGPDQFDEIFELAPPGRHFELYSRTRLKRSQ